MSVGTGEIPYDGSAVNEVMYRYTPNTAAVSSIGGGPAAYNGVTTEFNFKVSSRHRVLFNKSYLRVTGKAANMVIGEASPVLVGTSIPWNSIAALLQSTELQLNQSASTTEHITQNLGDGSMVRMLTSYSRDALESMEDSLFTPCIEDTRDKLGPAPGVTYLSNISQTRRATQLTDQPGNGQRIHSKNIYLHDIFSSLAIPAAFFVQDLQMRFQFKAANDILIKDTVCLGAAAPSQMYYITNVELNMCFVTLSESQLKIETSRVLGNEIIFRENFIVYDALQKTHTQGTSYRDSNVKNMQASVMMIPSSTAADGIGCNRYQYVYGCDAVNPGISGISTFQMRYDNVLSPSTPMNISNTFHGTNTELYGQYRLLCNRTMDRETGPALLFSNFAPARAAVDDESTYVLFCATFFPVDADLHKLMGGADHEIILSGGGSEPIVLVRIRASFIEIRGDTTVYMIN